MEAVGLVGLVGLAWVEVDLGGLGGLAWVARVLARRGGSLAGGGVGGAPVGGLVSRSWRYNIRLGVGLRIRAKSQNSE